MQLVCALSGDAHSAELKYVRPNSGSYRYAERSWVQRSIGVLFAKIAFLYLNIAKYMSLTSHIATSGPVLEFINNALPELSARANARSLAGPWSGGWAGLWAQRLATHPSSMA